MSAPLSPFARDETGSAAPAVGLGAAEQVVQVVARAAAAGLPLAQAVAAYSAEFPTGRIRRALRSLSRALEAGVPLEAAIRQVRPRLPEYAGGLVQAALESGQMGRVLEQHLKSARRTRDLRFRFWSSVAYPVDQAFEGVYPGVSGGPPVIPAGNLVGAPALCMPTGFGENGLPTSIAFMGAPFSESSLVMLGGRYQARTDWHTRRPPGFD